MSRYSRQREIILNDLNSRCDHPTAEMIYHSVRNEIPNISLGTVYRNLNKLSEDKQILSFAMDDKIHYDGKIYPHLHLCCTKCGSIEDQELTTVELDGLSDELSDISNVIVYGRCKSCR